MDKSIYLFYITILLIITIYYIYIHFNNKTVNITIQYKNKLIKFIKNKLSNSGKKLFLIPIFQLGDNIIINGAIRYYCTKYTTVVLVCTINYYDQISYMYRDLDNLIFYIIPSKYTIQYIDYYIPIKDNEIDNILKDKNIQTYNLLINITNNTHFTKRTYQGFNLDLDIGYNYFKIDRDYNKELELYNRLINIIGYNYIVIIDDEKRKFVIDDIYYKNINLPIFKIGSNSINSNKKLESVKDPYIFNYLTILEKANKILSIDSSIPWLCDFLNLKCNLFIYNNRHDYIVYRNKNIKFLDIDFKNRISSFTNTNNYTYKYPYEYITSYLE
jgi:hypothetical protein